MARKRRMKPGEDRRLLMMLGVAAILLIGFMVYISV
jgi:hypothetical protein